MVWVRTEWNVNWERGKAFLQESKDPLQDTEKMKERAAATRCEASPREPFRHVCEDFPNLWKDTGNVVGIPENQFMEIPLVDNWRELYKPGQARVYPVGKRDQEVIDTEFDKLYAEKRMEYTKTPTPFSIPCFVVLKYTAGKGHEVRRAT